MLLLFAGCVLAGCAVKPQRPVTARSIAQSAAAPVGVIGASPETLKTMLGPPVLRRVDGGAQVWLYNSPLCRLDLILYPGSSGTPVVALAAPSPRGVSSASCIASLERSSLENRAAS